MSRLCCLALALAALATPALADNRPIVRVPEPTGAAGRFVANGGTIARNPNTAQIPIGNPFTRPLCGPVTKDNPNVPVPCR